MFAILPGMELGRAVATRRTVVPHTLAMAPSQSQAPVTNGELERLVARLQSAEAELARVSRGPRGSGL